MSKAEELVRARIQDGKRREQTDNLWVSPDYPSGNFKVMYMGKLPGSSEKKMVTVTLEEDEKLPPYQAFIDTGIANGEILNVLERLDLGNRMPDTDDSSPAIDPVRFQFNAEKLKQYDARGCAKYEKVNGF